MLFERLREPNDPGYDGERLVHWIEPHSGAVTEQSDPVRGDQRGATE